MPPTIDAQVAEILTRVGRLPAAAIDRDADLGALGLDSIVMVEVIFALEETFDISVPYSTEAGPLRMGALVDMVADLVAKRG